MRKRISIWRIAMLVLICFLVLYLLGPRPATPDYNNSLASLNTNDLSALERSVKQRESLHKLREDNEARIIWNNDSTPAKTETAILYLHGFSASQEEGDPVHLTIAKNFGCNLYLTRLADHGLDTAEQLLNFTPDRLWQSAVEALSIAKAIGNRVIVMGTSTGGTLALKLAATFPNDVYALMLLSPNIEINNPNAWLLNNHWGLQIARMVQKSNYVYSKDERKIYRQYWSSPYRLEAAVQLQEMMETTMQSSTFRKVNQPLFMAYYYADDQHQDNVVRVDAMLNMFEQVATPLNQKMKISLPETGDHVIGSYIKSGDYVGVINASRQFVTKVLAIPQSNFDTVVSTRSLLPLQ